MREPSTPMQKWGWWEAALAGKSPPITEGDPQVGFYKARRWPRQPFWLPARIWLVDGEINPETGELLNQEWMFCEVDGERKNPVKMWSWLAHNPVTEDEFEWLVAARPLQPKNPPPSKPPTFQRPRPSP